MPRKATSASILEKSSHTGERKKVASPTLGRLAL
jgi:hypothetical protein